MKHKILDDLYYSQKYNIPHEESYSHYNSFGFIEKYQPSPHFDVDWFIKRYNVDANCNILDFIIENNASPNMYWANEEWSVKELINSIELENDISSTVIIGLLGSGRTLLNNILDKSISYQFLKHEGLENCGFKSRIPMIYSGHATLKTVSSFQKNPDFSKKKLIEPLANGCHQMIFMLRHPLDSLFSNYFWWQHCILINSAHSLGISSVYRGLDEFIEKIESDIVSFCHFVETGEITKNNNGFGKFLSLNEFIYETFLWSQVPSMNVFKFEDFLDDYLGQIEKLEILLSPNCRLPLSKARILGSRNNYKYICSKSESVKKIIQKSLTNFSEKAIVELGFELEI